MALAEQHPSPSEDVGRRVRLAIRALIGERRTSVRRLAQQLDMPESSLHARLNGGTRLSIEETSKIAELLGRTFYELVELSQDDRLTGTGCYAESAGLWGLGSLPGQMELPFTESEPRPPLVSVT